MPEWLTITAAVVGGTTGTGGLWAAIRWWAAWKERREEAQRRHEREMAERFEKMQQAFLAALEASDEKLERHRAEHLADTKRYAESLAEVGQLLTRMQSQQ